MTNWRIRWIRAHAKQRKLFCDAVLLLLGWECDSRHPELPAKPYREPEGDGPLQLLKAKVEELGGQAEFVLVLDDQVVILHVPIQQKDITIAIKFKAEFTVIDRKKKYLTD